MTFLWLILFTSCLHLIGLAVLKKWGQETHHLLGHFLSFHLGLGIFYLLSVLFLSLRMNKPIYIWLALMLLTGSAIFFLSRYNKIQVFIAVGISTVFTLFSFLMGGIYLSGDSYLLLSTSEAYWSPELTLAGLNNFLNMWGVFGLIAFSPNKLVGLDIYYLLPSLSTLYFCCAWYGMVFELMKSLPISKKFIPWCALITVLIFMSALMALFHSNYVHLNMLSTQYLSFGILLLALYKKFPQLRWALKASVIYLVIFSLFRMESALFAVMVTMISLAAMSKDAREKSKTVFSLGMGTLAMWNFILASLIQGSSHLAGPRDFLLMAILLSISSFIIWYSPRFLNNLILWIPLGGVFSHLILIFIKGDALISSDESVLNHFFKHYHWGWSWVWILVSAVIGFIWRVQRKDCIFGWGSSVVVTFILLLLSLGAFRSPYHSGFGDSAERMLLHIFPWALSLATFSMIYVLDSLFVNPTGAQNTRSS